MSLLHAYPQPKRHGDAAKDLTPCDGSDLASRHPEIAAEWNTERNGSLMPEQVTPNSNRKAQWICALGHRYAATVSSRVTRKCGCPVCAGRVKRKKLECYDSIARRGTRELPQTGAVKKHNSLSGDSGHTDMQSGA